MTLGPTRVVHRADEPFDISIMRPSKWGNPFSHLPGTLATYRVHHRGEAIARYEAWIVQQPELMDGLWELVGKTLGCCCKPRRCHGDVLAKLCNALVGVPNESRPEPADPS